MNTIKQLESDAKGIICLLNRMIERGEHYNKIYNILIKKLERKEKEIIKIKKRK